MSDLYLTDKQYLELLKTVRASLDKLDDVSIFTEDSTVAGNKYTISNVGLCTEDFVTEETAMWPDEYRKGLKAEYTWPQARARKYLRDKHKCPLDVRKNPDANGCFYACMMFQRKFKTPNLAQIKELYDQQIATAEKERQ